jgi:hypothetical protein
MKNLLLAALIIAAFALAAALGLSGCAGNVAGGLAWL